MGAMGDIIDRYVASRRWAGTTRRLNCYTLRHFAEVVGDVQPGELTAEHVERWWATQSHVCPSTARTRRSTVANFLRWCRHAGLLDGDPLATIPVPREPRRVPVTLSDDEVRALLRALPDERAWAVAMLMLGLGLRCVDVARLEVHDVDLSRMLVTVHGKGGHTDVLPLPTAAADAVCRYLRRHPAPAGPLIRDARWHRHPVTAQRISELFAQWCRDAGVKQGRWDGRGAHALRRTCLTDLLRSGATVRQVQQVARHASLQTTSRYLALDDAEELRSAVERELVP